MSGDRDHARLGASNAYRWINCPGSVRAEDGLEDRESRWAQEGTAAHSLAALAFEKERDPMDWLGETIDEVVVTEEMVSGVREYLDIVRKIAQDADDSGHEEKFDLAPINPPEPMFGTTDFWAWYRRGLLIVVDLKFGKGVIVEATGNHQTRYYALGAWIKLALRDRDLASSIKKVRMVIVQPRVLDEEGEPSVTYEDITIQELRAWGKELLWHAKETQRENAPRRAGDWCKFCKAKKTCPEFRDQALAVAQMEFSDIADPPPLPKVQELTPEQVSQILNLAPRLETWINEIRALARAELESGREIPGYALKPTKGHRKWTDPDSTISWLRELGADDEDIFVAPILKSPAQVEKLLPKGTKLPEGMAVAPSTGFKLCSDSDPKAIEAAPAELTALP